MDRGGSCRTDFGILWSTVRTPGPDWLCGVANAGIGLYAPGSQINGCGASPPGRYPQPAVRSDLLSAAALLVRAAATARRAQHADRCARIRRCRGCRSRGRRPGSVSPSSDFGENRFLSASSNEGTRNTPESRRRSRRRGSPTGAWRRTRRPAQSARPGCGTSSSPPSWAREAHLGDDLVGFERGLEQALEELVGHDLALGRGDGGAEAEAGGRVIRIGIVVGDRAADRAAVAHRRDRRSCRRGRRAPGSLPHHRRVRHLGMARQGADDDERPSADAEALDPVEIDDVRRRGEPQLHGRQQGLAAGEQLCLLELAEHVRGCRNPLAR